MIDVEDATTRVPVSAATAALQWGHVDDRRGRLPSRTCHVDARYRFNGATSMMTWKTRELAPRVLDRSQLQWGHVDDDVEDANVRVELAYWHLASMGPRR